MPLWERRDDQRFTFRITILVAVLSLWAVLLFSDPSMSYLFFTSGPEIGPFTRNRTYLELHSVEIKLNRNMLSLDGEPQPKDSHRAVFHAWPKIERMKGVMVTNASSRLPSGPVMGLVFREEDDAVEFCDAFPPSSHCPVLRIKNAVFLAGKDDGPKVERLLRELRKTDWDRAAALPLLAAMALFGLIVTIPSCRKVELTRPVPLSHATIPADSEALWTKARQENLIVLRLGLGLVVASLVADLVTLKMGGYPLWWEWNDIILLLGILVGAAIMTLSGSGMRGTGLFFIYSTSVLCGSLILLFQHGVLITTLPSSAVTTGLGLGCLMSTIQRCEE